MVTFEEEDHSYSSLDLPNLPTEPEQLGFSPSDFEQLLLKGFQNIELKENDFYNKNSEEKYYYDSDISNLEGERDTTDTKYQYPLRPYAEDCPFYLKTAHCKFGFHCKFNHPVKRPYQEKKSRGGFVEQTGPIECKFYLTTGGCKYGQACRYNHSKEKSEIAPQELDPFGLPIQLDDKEKENEREGFAKQTGQVECKYYLTTGGCKFGKACKYSHSEEKSYKYIEKSELEPPELNFLGLPIRVLEKVCAFYMLHGSCAYGVNCRFHHPDPTSAEGSNPYDSSPPGASVGKYSLGNHNEYQASKYPQERTKHLHSAPAVNNLIKTADVSTFRQQRIQVEEFPERPGQPECSYFMKTGACKFRSSCKFHHPKSWASKVPLRPGRRICQHYEKYGACKYGTRCLFDHPELPSGSNTVAFGESKMAGYGDGSEGLIQQFA